MSSTATLRAGQKIRVKANGEILTVRQYVPHMHPPIITEESSCLFHLSEVEAVADGVVRDTPTRVSSTGQYYTDEHGNAQSVDSLREQVMVLRAALETALPIVESAYLDDYDREPDSLQAKESFEALEAVRAALALGEGADVEKCPRCGEKGYTDPSECSFCQDQKE